MRYLNETDEESAVTLTPLIDVVFLLIIFFLVATTFHKLEDDLAINLPESRGGAQAERTEREIVINVRENGMLVMNGEIVSDEQLNARLAAAAQRDTNTPIVIRGDRKAYHEHIVNIISACVVNRLANVNIAIFPVEETAEN